MSYAKILGSMNEPQSVHEQVTPEMRQVDGGGFGFQMRPLDAWKRFVTIGALNNTMHTSALAMLEQHMDLADKALAEHGAEQLMAEIVRVRKGGLAPKVSPQLLAYAWLSKNAPAKAKAGLADQFLDVINTGTQFFEYQLYANLLGIKGGRNRRRQAMHWFEMPVDRLAYQMLKYRSRRWKLDYWTHVGWNWSQALQKFHPKPVTPAHDALFDFVVNGNVSDEAPELVKQFVAVRDADNVEDVIRMVQDWGLTWEFVPDRWFKEKKLWEALIENLPATATMRKMSTLASLGLLDSMRGSVARVFLHKMGDVDWLRGQRVHPISLYIAAKTYSQGHGSKGSLEWSVNEDVLAVLIDSIQGLFETEKPIADSVLFGLDLSASMTWPESCGMGIRAFEVSMLIISQMMKHHVPFKVVGFSSSDAIDITAAVNGYMSLRQLMASPEHVLGLINTAARDKMRGYGWFGGTNIGAAVEFALDKDKEERDTIVLLTDNDVNVGRHAFQLWRKYRQKYPKARLAVLAMQGNISSIVDPDDPTMMDFVGMDLSVPKAVRMFVYGQV